MDEELAPALRRFVFHEFRRDDVHFEEVVANAAPGLVASLGPAAGRFARLLTGVRYGAASDERADRAREQVVRVLDRLDRELDGREYLAGERFSVADLTTAALLYPLVLPPQAPTTFQQMPEPYERFRESVRHRRSFGWVEEMFRRHR
jgi:glutathione S-transferase